MPGFINGVMIADNVNFSGSTTSAQITADGQLLIGSTASPNIKPGTITSPGGTISIGYSSPNITLDVAGGTLTWNTITSADNPKQIVIENAYITSGALQCTLVLPAAAAVGTTFIVTGYSSLFQITQNALQSITIGAATTTVGATGTLTSTHVADHVEIVCIVANTVFKVIDSIGNLTVA